MSTTLATLLLLGELATSPATPSEPATANDQTGIDNVDVEVEVEVDSNADSNGDEPKAVPSPDADANAQTETDPWAESPDNQQQAPTSEAVRRQANPALSEALSEGSKKKGYAKYESPQHFALELKFGPYLPAVDRNYAGPDTFGPYAKVFGETDDRGVTTAEPKSGLMPALAFEWQFFNPAKIGPLGIGYTISFFRDSAKALLANPDPDADSIRSEADSTVFWTMPMALQLVYRLEIFANRWRVPIVPYAKGGLAWALWWSKDGNGNLSRNSRGEKALGGVWGWQLNAGGMLQLDFLERGSSRNLDRTSGINHTYLFGEFQLSRINNFGRKESMSLGDATWFVGLALEF
ncbi:MAG TPA: hypothetical protein ENJ18_04255 [Nannocystis exedens]|nr:hypothetical protein [Nannocystis exedens]